jgi:hypothetical protein
MDAAEYSVDRSVKPIKPPVRTYTKVHWKILKMKQFSVTFRYRM